MRLTVITTCFNASSCIRRTIESVLSQDFKDFEYVIMDGGSADNTLEIAREYEASFSEKNISYRIYSAPDHGIYDGMNNGVGHALGQYINFMNADDIFYDEHVLSNVFEGTADCHDIIYGDAAEFEYGRYYYFQKDFSLITKRMPFSHQSVFARRELLIKHPFSPDYSIAADYDFLLNCYDDGAVFHDSGVMICVVSKDGVSSRKLYDTFLETEKMLNSHGIHRYSDAALSRKLFALGVKQVGMDHLPDAVKLCIRRIQRKMRHQEKQVTQ